LHERGFTLIQILILFAMLGVFIAGFLMIFHPLDMIQNMQDQKRKSDLVEIQKALELYYQKNGRYPFASDTFEIMQTKKPLQWGQDSWGSYIQILPDDPVPFSRTYVYYSNPLDGNQSYWLYTSLERLSDEPAACNDTCSLGNGNIPKEACGVHNNSIHCNFGVSSQNVSP